MLQCGFVRSNFSLAMAKTPAARKGAVVSVQNLERVDGIEPTYSAWKAAALPLCYTRAEHASALPRGACCPSHPALFGTPFHPAFASAWWGKQDSNLRSLRSGFTVRPLCRSGHSPSRDVKTDPERPAGPLRSRSNKGLRSRRAPG